MSGPTFDELADRTRQSADYHGGVIPRDTALVWDGYLAALLERGLISVGDHMRLVAMLPEVPDDPVIPLFFGWQGDVDALPGGVSESSQG